MVKQKLFFPVSKWVRIYLLTPCVPRNASFSRKSSDHCQKTFAYPLSTEEAQTDHVF